MKYQFNLVALLLALLAAAACANNVLTRWSTNFDKTVRNTFNRPWPAWLSSTLPTCYIFTDPGTNIKSLYTVGFNQKLLRKSWRGEVYLARKMLLMGKLSEDLYEITLLTDPDLFTRVSAIDPSVETHNSFLGPRYVVPYIRGIPLPELLSKMWPSWSKDDYKLFKELMRRIGKVGIAKLLSDGYYSFAFTLDEYVLPWIDENGLPTEPEHFRLADRGTVLPLTDDNVDRSDTEQFNYGTARVTDVEPGIDVKVTILMMINAFFEKFHEIIQDKKFTVPAFLMENTQEQTQMMLEVYDEVQQEFQRGGFYASDLELEDTDLEFYKTYRFLE